jgi:hypothetical protein
MDFYDIIHYVIGILIVFSMLWIVIQIHNYLSKYKNPKLVMNEKSI